MAIDTKGFGSQPPMLPQQPGLVTPEGLGVLGDTLRTVVANLQGGGGSSVEQFNVGARVKATGLAARPELNGAIGVIEAHLGGPSSERVPVRFEHNGESVRIKRSNLVLAT
eukprot:11199229-Karenia_brevis.AAC.1